MFKYGDLSYKISPVKIEKRNLVYSYRYNFTKREDLKLFQIQCLYFDGDEWLDFCYEPVEFWAPEGTDQEIFCFLKQTISNYQDLMTPEKTYLGMTEDPAFLWDIPNIKDYLSFYVKDDPLQQYKDLSSFELMHKASEFTTHYYYVLRKIQELHDSLEQENLMQFFQD